MEDRIFSLSRFYGLNESPDGDTKLRFGEASDCVNFAVTREGNLKRRAGSRSLCSLCPGKPVRGIWQGLIKGRAFLVASCGGKLYKLSAGENGLYNKTELGSLDCSLPTHFFPFGNILYILTGSEYLCYDGEILKAVEPYRPLVAITLKPDGSFETLEQINKLGPQRRAWLSPDGSGKSFKLPEKDLLSLDWLKDLKSGLELEPDKYTADLSAGSITFTEPPAEGVNSLEVGWSVKKSFRSDVEKMRFSELFNGSQDTRVFLCGDGTNKLFYSGLDYEGRPRADYFPDLNEVQIGDENSPVTGLIRHYSSLLCFKADSLWSVRYGEIELKDGKKAAAFYSGPINRSLGLSAPGQLNLVLNSPFALFGKDLYRWQNAGPYGGNLNDSQRQAQRISDRIHKSLAQMEIERAVCFDDAYTQEYYISDRDSCLVYNYAADAWYKYRGLGACAFCRKGESLLLGDEKGSIKELSYRWKSDDGAAIEAYFESGAMSFNKDFRRKFSGLLWIGLKPENRGELFVTLGTDRRSVYDEKRIVSSLAGFNPLSFSHFSFKTNRKPKVHRLKLKAKKFVYYKLIFRSRSAHSAATVLSSSLRLRYTGYAK